MDNDLTAAEKAEVITNCDHLRSLKFSPALPYAAGQATSLLAAPTSKETLRPLGGEGEVEGAGRESVR
ncbi:MAG: hypothetical protein C3F12_12985 [Candidatus Methylomirabilota bacterium]|nr:MAG: hypothetical protein C3F12_12985 [candidate division NC10 bacterium]